MSDQNDNPVLDEQTLARLLEAAYVLQEHNRAQREIDLSLELHSDQLRQREAAKPDAPAEPETSSIPSPTSTLPAPPPGAESDEERLAPRDYTLTLADIVETQHQIQVRHFDLENTISVVTGRVTEYARATGAGIAIIEGKKVRYKSAHGTLALPQGSEISLDKALCCATLRTGQVIRCTDVNSEFLFDPEEGRRRGIQSMIAVPIYHDGGIAGALELYFAKVSAFAEQDVHTAQLMAGLVTEALAREAEMAKKNSMSAERALMLETLEKLKPGLVALAEAPDAIDPDAGGGGDSADEVARCASCGHLMLGEEQFCGRCGMPRTGDSEPPTLQSKLATLFHMQQTTKKTGGGEPANGSGPAEATPVDSIESRLPELFPPIRKVPEMGEAPADEITAEPDGTAGQEAGAQLDIPEPERESAEAMAAGLEDPEAEVALAQPAADITWNSAAAARDSLEQLAISRGQPTFARFFKAHRGDIYLAVALVLAAGVIRWGFRSNPEATTAGNAPSAAASHRRQAPPDADLSWWDKTLIGLGLAEAPERPEYKGNPDTQVWVDLHTALYYCPGAELYGKTAGGKFATQRDAQLDQFEPASRKACE